MPGFLPTPIKPEFLGVGCSDQFFEIPKVISLCSQVGNPCHKVWQHIQCMDGKCADLEEAGASEGGPK